MQAGRASHTQEGGPSCSETEALLLCPESLMPPFPQFGDLVLFCLSFRLIFKFIFFILKEETNSAVYSNIRDYFALCF